MLFANAENIDKLTFLFGARAGPNLDSFGHVLGVNLYDLSVLSSLEGARRRVHGWVGQRGWCAEAQLL
jgi:hypothetical protein